MMYVSQIIILFTLNLCSALCQLYLNKTGEKKSGFESQIIQWSCGLGQVTYLPGSYLLHKDDNSPHLGGLR